MAQLAIQYTARSRGDADRLSLSGATAPAPGRYEAVIADPVLFRLGMLALGDVVRAEFEWKSYEEWMEDLERYLATVDPVVGIHPDGLSFEGFSLDGSTCGWVHFANSVFAEPTERRAGCTNIDFSPALAAYLNSMGVSRPITLSIGTSSGVELKDAAGGAVERKIDLPDNWMSGFAELHAGLAQAEVTLPLARADLFNICRTLQLRKPPKGSRQRALVFELAPGARAVARIEPWDQRLPLQAAPEGLIEPVEWRVYGRRRLTLLQRLLPHARSARVHLLGDSRPSYWEVDLGAARFILSMSPWTARKFTASIAESLRGPRAASDAEEIARAAAFLADVELASFDEIAAALEIDPGEARALGQALCRQGYAIAEPAARGLRWRPIHSLPFAQLAGAGAPTTREANAAALLADGKLDLIGSGEREGLRVASARCQGASGTYNLHLALNADGSFASAECECAWMRRQRGDLKGGPCKHLLALRDHVLRGAGREAPHG